ncbi:hypothetical protein EON65_07710 [archaeon]|nr:MAG: hypothetical protein EON65_07710 [archaeon]
MSCALILYVTLSADYIAESAGRIIPGGSNIQSFIAPLLLSIISGVMPEIAKHITSFEMWDSSETNTSIMLVRVYLSNLVNVLLLLSSYMVLADPFLLAYDSQLRSSFGLSVSSQYACRMDQVGDGLFTLMIVTWVIEKLSFSLMPYANAFYYTYLLRSSAVKKLEFSVADMMVKKLTFVGYIFATFIFAPPSLIFMPLLLYLGFKTERLVLRAHYAKPQRLFKGARVALVYTCFYLFTFMATACTLGVYFMTAKTFPKECDLQDAYVHLCASGSYDTGTQLCTLDSSSRFYGYYRDTPYPREVCAQACGAFVKDTSHLSPLHAAVRSVSTITFIWTVCFHYPYMPWLLLFGLLLGMGRVRNTLEVLRMSAFNKERAYETELAANEAERRRQEKIIRRLKTIEGGGDQEDKGD